MGLKLIIRSYRKALNKQTKTTKVRLQHTRMKVPTEVHAYNVTQPSGLTAVYSCSSKTVQTK